MLLGKNAVLGLDVSLTEKNRFRAKRFEQFYPLIEAVLDEKGSCSILDLGGTQTYWQSYGKNRLDRVTVTLVNRKLPDRPDTEFVRYTEGDVRNLSRHDDNSFDIVHSNSVIEHVGHWQDMKAMASEVRRLASRYYIQTPNFWFPVEPHFRSVGFHWLPEPVRQSMLMRKARGFRKRSANVDEATDEVQSVVLLDARQLAWLFPDATIRREKFYGFTKSLMAVRTA